VLTPGLYIPDYYWVINMRVAEAEASVNTRRGVEIDSNIFESFRERYEKKIKCRLPKFIQKAFEGYIISDRYESDWRKYLAVELVSFDNDTVVALNKYMTQ
jgi:Zn-finger domain-containing protein